MGCLPLVLGGMLAVAGGLVVLGKAQAWGCRGCVVRSCHLHHWCLSLNRLVTEPIYCLPAARLEQLLQRCNLILAEGAGLGGLCPPIRRRCQAPTVVRP